MTPLAYYQQQLAQGVISADAQQLAAIQNLDNIYHALLEEHQKRAKLWTLMRRPISVQGLYLWGSVGIGKTFMMDCFYHCLPFKEKKRMHFHAFMRMIHAELKKREGEKNPLATIAKQIANETMVFCFDELVVSDIVDAMMLARLFDALFAQGVCLIATSNIEPDRLYWRGLQREQFLPAIQLIKKHLKVMHITTTEDYRQLHLNKSATCYIPDDDIADENMEKDFNALINDHVAYSAPILLCDRQVSIVKQAGDVIWFDFNVLCKPPRSQHDYLAIADQYKTVMLSHIPIIEAHQDNIIALFIRLIDVLYDQKIRLIFSAAAELDDLYQGGKYTFEFQRTQSRLVEMQSHEWMGNLS
jgi:cell division protein ZapE